MDAVSSNQAQEALAIIDGAQRRVAHEVGLPHGYWWALAAAWLGLGVIGEFGPQWLTVVATVGFGAGHSFFASKLLSGRNRTDGLQVSAAVAGRKTPAVVIVMLCALVGVTIAIALGLQADDADHPALWAGAFTAAVVGFGGPEILSTLLRWVRA